MSTDTNEQERPTLSSLTKQAGQALDDINSASEQYRQARVLYQSLAEGRERADGTLYYQPTEGHPIQLPPPNPALLAELLETAAEKLRSAARRHWQILRSVANSAMAIIDDAAVAEQEALAAQFGEGDEELPAPPMIAP
jgi:hypothetical protein